MLLKIFIEWKKLEINIIIWIRNIFIVLEKKRMDIIVKQKYHHFELANHLINLGPI